MLVDKVFSILIDAESRVNASAHTLDDVMHFSIRFYLLLLFK